MKLDKIDDSVRWKKYVGTHGVTEDEAKCLNALVDAESLFVKLPAIHPDDASEFSHAIFVAQRTVLTPKIDTPMTDGPPVNGINIRVPLDTRASWAEMTLDTEHDGLQFVGAYGGSSDPIMTIEWREIRYLGSPEELGELGLSIHRVMWDWIEKRKAAGLIKSDIVSQKRWLAKEQRRLILEQEGNATEN